MLIRSVTIDNNKLNVDDAHANLLTLELFHSSTCNKYSLHNNNDAYKKRNFLDENKSIQMKNIKLFDLPVNSPGVQQMIKSEMNKRDVKIAENINNIKTV